MADPAQGLRPFPRPDRLSAVGRDDGEVGIDVLHPVSCRVFEGLHDCLMTGREIGGVPFNRTRGGQRPLGLPCQVAR